MNFCLFIVFHDREKPAARLSVAEHARLDALLRGVPGLEQALVHTPARAHDPLLDDGAPPQLALQLYFDRLLDLEAAAGRGGPLHALDEPDLLPTLAAAEVEHQVMAVRAYAVPDPGRAAAREGASCTYLVAYEGPAEDPQAWLHEYLAHHTPLMARLPGIRGLEVYTRVDCVSHLPWARAECMQRNKVVFDSPAALTAALDSPLRHEMRAHFKSLPRFSGAVTHHPMSTRAVPVG
jgi:uncharacterized protein (TIGR02118 family)